MTKFPIAWDEAPQDDVSVPSGVVNTSSTTECSVLTGDMASADPSEQSEKPIQCKVGADTKQLKSEVRSLRHIWQAVAAVIILNSMN